MTLLPSRYPFPWRISLLLLRDAFLQRRRSFRSDAIRCVNQLPSALKIINHENIPSSGPCLFVMNHYARPGFPAWWIALGISAAVPVELHWVMTAAWTHLGPLEPVSRWLFPRLAAVYGFSTTPPMPPNPNEVETRARAVRQVLNFARATQSPVIGLAPEGRDNFQGVLGKPPQGAGRFIEHIVKYCQRIVPIGVYEDRERLCLSFGPPVELNIPPKISADQRDAIVSKKVMRAIARQLPETLRGEYDTKDGAAHEKNTNY